MANGLAKRLFLGRRAILWIGLALVASMAFAQRAAAVDTSACNFQNGLGSFSSTNQPGDCWRPYNDSSPFNRQLPQGAPLASGSSSMVNHLLAGGQVGYLVAGDPQRDGGVPIYWSQPSDPVYTLHCTKPWGRCAIEGMQIHVPASAEPTGGFATPGNDHDAHMTIVDQQSGWEYDLWNVQSKTGSTINFGWGGKTRIDGDGLGSAAVAADYGSIAGPIRVQELRDGLINHALTMAVPCTDSQVYPAQGTGMRCSDAGLPASSSIAMGSHFELNMSDSQIAALNVPTWKKTILTALAKYGAYVSDTTGNADQWGFETESSQSYTSFGQADPWVQFARSIGLRPYDFNNNGYQEYWFDLRSDVPWNRLQVVDVCAARGTCPASTQTPPDAGNDPLPAQSVPAPGSGDAAQGGSAQTDPAAPGTGDPGKCWRDRANWGREYRRSHARLGPRYRRLLAQMARTCALGATA